MYLSSTRWPEGRLSWVSVSYETLEAFGISSAAPTTRHLGRAAGPGLSAQVSDLKAIGVLASPTLRAWQSLGLRGVAIDDP